MKKQIIMASGNKGKIKEAQEILEEYENYFQEVKTYISDVKTAQSLTLSHIYQKNETLTEKEKLIKFKHLRKEL